MCMWFQTTSTNAPRTPWVLRDRHGFAGSISLLASRCSIELIFPSLFFQLWLTCSMFVCSSRHRLLAYPYTQSSPTSPTPPSLFANFVCTLCLGALRYTKPLWGPNLDFCVFSQQFSFRPLFLPDSLLLFVVLSKSFGVFFTYPVS